MKKLFYAKKMVDIVFVYDVGDPDMFHFGIKNRRIFPDALGCIVDSFFEEEEKNMIGDRFLIQEISNINQLSGDWADSALIWGIEDITAKEFLREYNDEEYQQYLRLKKKFEE